MWSSLRRAIAAPMTHTLLVSQHTASRCEAGIRAISALKPGLVFPAAISAVSFAFQSPDRANRRRALIAGHYPSARRTLGKLGETARFTRRPEQTSRRAVTAQGDFARMEHAKLANGSGRKPIGHSTSAPKKAARKKAESARPLNKEIGS